MAWDYAELSKIAKAAGGPEKLLATMDVYGHVSKRMHKASADNMERYISEIA